MPYVCHLLQEKKKNPCTAHCTKLIFKIYEIIHESYYFSSSPFKVHFYIKLEVSYNLDCLDAHFSLVLGLAALSTPSFVLRALILLNYIPQLDNSLLFYHQFKLPYTNNVPIENDLGASKIVDGLTICKQG